MSSEPEYQLSDQRKTRPLTRREQFMELYARVIARLEAEGKLPSPNTDNAHQGAESVAIAGKTQPEVD